MKHYTTQPDGTTTCVDARTPSWCATMKVQEMRRRCEAAIIEAAPEYRQRNAALGLLTEAETAAVKAAITAPRARMNAIEAQLNELLLDWNGLENTRASVCDAIEAIRWEEG